MKPRWNDSLWPTASGRIDKACGMLGSTLVVGRGHSQVDGDIFFARVCRHGERNEDWERTYFDDYYPLDERVPRVTQLPDSRLVHVTDLYTEQERRTSATYNELLPLGGYQNGLNVRLDGPEGSSIYWALADSTKRGGWGSRQIRMIESLLPICGISASASGAARCAGLENDAERIAGRRPALGSSSWTVEGASSRRTTVP